MVIIEDCLRGGFISGLAGISERRQQDPAQEAIAHAMPDVTAKARREVFDDRHYRASNRQADERFDGH
jgi:hypothetical protein